MREFEPLRLTTGSRLHFGPLAWGPGAPRQFGGLGVMIEEPRLEMRAEAASSWGVHGPLSERIARLIPAACKWLEREGRTVDPLRIEVLNAPREHTGLGVGTQLCLAVARLLCARAGIAEPPIDLLARMSGRGHRSGVGLHGFVAGGLILEGGHGASGGVPPLLARMLLPEDWWVLLTMPVDSRGLHGPDEDRAFAEMPPISNSDTGRLCRIVLLELLPAVRERNLPAFGAALSEFQGIIAECFAPVQGGRFASSELEALADELHAAGLLGVAQSSWGPTLYGFCDWDEPRRRQLVEALPPSHAEGRQFVWTRARNRGFELEARAVANS